MLKADGALISIYSQYTDLVDIFSKDLVTKLPKYTRINDHAVNLVKEQQPPYGLVYSLGPVELEILKTLIKTNLANGFIKRSKSPADAFILCVKKLDRKLQLCVDYKDLNNVIIKNCYPLPLISNFLD